MKSNRNKIPAPRVSISTGWFKGSKPVPTPPIDSATVPWSCVVVLIGTTGTPGAQVHAWEQLVACEALSHGLWVLTLHWSGNPEESNVQPLSTFRPCATQIGAGMAQALHTLQEPGDSDNLEKIHPPLKDMLWPCAQINGWVQSRRCTDMAWPFVVSTRYHHSDDG